MLFAVWIYRMCRANESSADMRCVLERLHMASRSSSILSIVHGHPPSLLDTMQFFFFLCLVFRLAALLARSIGGDLCGRRCHLSAEQRQRARTD